MRALKPYIDEINAKYTKAEDALKKQQEIMGLYSKYGASPMGGCLPMLIQMPVFIAMFNFVPNAIELRQESFLWAHDLSSFDALIQWNTSIWPTWQEGVQDQVGAHPCRWDPCFQTFRPVSSSCINPL